MAVTAAPRLNEAATYTPLTPHIGCRVEGVDIASRCRTPPFARLRRALGDHSLLVLPDQDITPEQHIAFSRRFGPLEDHVLSDFCLPGHPEIFVVSNIIENGRHIGAYGGSKRYHSDLSYLDGAEPGLAVLLSRMPGRQRRDRLRQHAGRLRRLAAGDAGAAARPRRGA